HPPERVTEKALEAWERGATEVCMQGGLAAQLTPQRYLEYLRAVKDPLPEMHVHAFSPAEIDWAMRKWEGSLEEYLRMLREAGLFTEFVPLGFIHYNTRLYNEGDGRPGPGFAEDLRAHAIPRLYFQGLIDNLQVSWVKLGEKMSQLLMWCGANDFSGTLMEESISRMAGATAGEYLAADRIRELVGAIGLVAG